MKKILSLLMAFSLLLVGGVLADNQAVTVDVNDHISFTLDTTSLDYGSLIPGETSATKDTLFTIGANNNVPLTVSIQVDTTSNNLFENIYYELVTEDTPVPFESKLSKATAVTKDYADPNGPSQKTLQSVLMVPSDQASGTDISGIVVFTAMKDIIDPIL